jgi:hypothetical protein
MRKWKGKGAQILTYTKLIPKHKIKTPRVQRERSAQIPTHTKLIPKTKKTQGNMRGKEKERADPDPTLKLIPKHKIKPYKGTCMR